MSESEIYLKSERCADNFHPSATSWASSGFGTDANLAFYLTWDFALMVSVRQVGLTYIFDNARKLVSSLSPPDCKEKVDVRLPAEMPSDHIQVEPHVLEFMNQIDESAAELVERPVAREPPTTRPLKRTVRKLSEPAHKSMAPAKPILKSKGSVPGTSTPTQVDSRGSHASAVKSNVPLRFVSRKAPPTVDATPAHAEVVPSSPASPDSPEEVWYTPPSALDDHGEGENSDYLGSGRQDTAQADRRSENFFKEPPAPPPTPTLRASFSQDVPYQGYPLTPRNTFRGKHRTPPIVDELDHKRHSGQFPSRQSFTFSPPAGTPSPSEFPLPPSPPEASQDGQLTQTASSAQKSGPKNNVSSRRLSWHPTFKRRSQLNETPERPEPTRLSSKRKSNSETELSTKRRKVVKFDVPTERRQHPPMKRRLTPYYEPLSSKVGRFFRSLIAPFVKTEEEKEERRAQKEKKKAEKRAKKEREELEESFRNFDDTFD